MAKNLGKQKTWEDVNKEVADEMVVSTGLSKKARVGLGVFAVGSLFGLVSAEQSSSSPSGDGGSGFGGFGGGGVDTGSFSPFDFATNGERHDVHCPEGRFGTIFRDWFGGDRYNDRMTLFPHMSLTQEAQDVGLDIEVRQTMHGASLFIPREADEGEAQWQRITHANLRTMIDEARAELEEDEYENGYDDDPEKENETETETEYTSDIADNTGEEKKYGYNGNGNGNGEPNVDESIVDAPGDMLDRWVEEDLTVVVAPIVQEPVVEEESGEVTEQDGGVAVVEEPAAQEDPVVESDPVQEETPAVIETPAQANPLNRFIHIGTIETEPENPDVYMYLNPATGQVHSRQWASVRNYLQWVNGDVVCNAAFADTAPHPETLRIATDIVKNAPNVIAGGEPMVVPTIGPNTNTASPNSGPVTQSDPVVENPVVANPVVAPATVAANPVVVENPTVEQPTVVERPAQDYERLTRLAVSCDERNRLASERTEGLNRARVAHFYGLIPPRVFSNDV